MYFSIDRTGHMALPGISPPSWPSKSSLWFLVSTHNTQQCVGTIYILWIEVCLVIKKKVATFWKTAHVSKRTANGKPHPAITWAQKAQHLDITNRGLSGCIINYSLSSNFLPGRIA